MSRLPSSLQPWWPWFKRAHRLLSFLLGVLGRLIAPALGRRGVPRQGQETSAATAAAEPDAVRLHRGPEVEPIRREMPPGTPPDHWAFAITLHRDDIPPLSTLAIRGGTVVGDLGAVVTPGRTLDLQTSEYWGIEGWREHPLFLRPMLPPVQEYDGTLGVLATRGAQASYYHFLFDALPRMEVLRRSMPEAQPDAWYLPRVTRYHREILDLMGLADLPVLESGPDRAVRARELLVPGLPNHHELAPRWLVEWLRAQLPPAATEGKPRRLYVTRGNVPNTRRLVGEDEIWPELERRGFTRIDPGTLSVRDQIDHFAAADVVVGVHGAALTNLLFSPPGAKVLHLMAPTYVKHCFWAILDTIPGTTYRYLLGDGPAVPPGGDLDGIQDDIAIAPARLLAEVDRLLE